MQKRITSTLAFVGTAAAATLAAALMSGNALAEGPIGDIRPATGALSRDQAKAELMAHRHELTSYASEWKLQQQDVQQASGTTRAQARADYIAARDQVRAMNSEGGSAAFAQVPARRPVIMAGESRQH